MHTENVAVRGAAGKAEMTPPFDPAPMRAYRHFRKNHNLLSALPFGGIGGYFQYGDAGYNEYAAGKLTPPDLGKRLVDYGVALGLSRTACKDEMRQILDVTEGYRNAAEQALNTIPMVERRPMQPDIPGFLQTLQDVRAAIEKSYACKPGGLGRFSGLNPTPTDQ